jgi:hypothetical protein
VNLVQTAEMIARQFHESHERAARSLGYAMPTESRVPWDEVPEANRRTMVETVRDLLAKGIIMPGPQAKVTLLQATGTRPDEHGPEGDTPRGDQR